MCQKQQKPKSTLESGVIAPLLLQRRADAVQYKRIYRFKESFLDEIELSLQFSQTPVNILQYSLK